MSRRLPSLNALRAFEAAARHSSFTVAAEELHVTHASISRHVRDLEAWLNVKLFRRLSRGVVLSEPGESYSRRLTPLFDELNAATQAVMLPKVSGELVVSVETAFAARWLVKRLGRFQAAHPEVDLTLDPDDERVNFRADPAELAVRFGEGNWPDVEIIELIDLVVYPVCSPALLKGEKRLGLAALKEHKLLHEESRQWWAEWLEQAGVTGVDSSRGPKFQNTHLSLQAAEAGQGFALGDNLLTADAIAEGRLVKPFEAEFDEGGYYVVWPKGAMESAAAKAFREWLQEEVAVFLEGAA